MFGCNVMKCLARVLGKCGNANVFKGARPKRGSPPAFFLIWRDFKSDPYMEGGDQGGRALSPAPCLLVDYHK